MRSRTNVLAVAERVISTMQHMPRGTQIKWEVNLNENMMMPFDTHDLSELLGNLLDNARKHAKSRVVLSGELSEKKDILTIEDDGPGIPDELIVRSLNRGETLSSGGSGHGIGLSIVEELISSSNCELALSKSTLGGLKVVISI